METDVAQAPAAKKKEPSKKNAARKKPQRIVSDTSESEDEIVIDDEDFEVEEIAPETAAKKGGRKAAGNAKPPAAATKKRGPAANKQGVGQKLLTEMLKPAENSPEKKVRKMRASPFNKKSGSKLANETSGSPSVPDNTEEVMEVAPAKPRPQRANRRQMTYVLSDSESEPTDDSDFNEDED